METKDTAGEVRILQPLPGRTADGSQAFDLRLTRLLRLLGVDAAHGPDFPSAARWEVHKALSGRTELPEEYFEALLEAAVYDPNPSFNRRFVEPALLAFGQRRVRLTLLGYLHTGTDAERAGAARAWYWTSLSVGDGRNTAAADEGSIVRDAWYEAALREFVANEDLDVRRCILPGLPLVPRAYPPQLHDLVEAAVAIARSHPDEYIRHRAEIQVGL
ncbi:hypothetical protein P3T27_004177 [Kitasatospora sp. MAA19]|uniref:hypothetical protein n=1 Tax=unclassified Kitasatospora TaxID=2633591 RepID=UPI002476D7C0|nr:hypothetical protein [Kitasatospora sp. MAA19]MDH6707440.1 hypothetical protein [Kitasatospora sp. MAA19]